MKLLTYLGMVLSFLLFVLVAKRIIAVDEAKMLQALVGAAGMSLIFGVMTYSKS